MPAILQPVQEKVMVQRNSPFSATNYISNPLKILNKNKQNSFYSVFVSPSQTSSLCAQTSFQGEGLVHLFDKACSLCVFMAHFESAEYMLSRASLFYQAQWYLSAPNTVCYQHLKNKCVCQAVKVFVFATNNIQNQLSKKLGLLCLLIGPSLTLREQLDNM